MDKPRSEVAVGLFVVLAFIILSLIVFFVSGVYYFRPGYHLKAHFDYVGIINRGAPVRFAGVRVGEVTDVQIQEPASETDEPKVEISFFVEKDVTIREHYEVSVRGNFVMGEPHVSIMPKEGAGRVLKNGDVVEAGVSPYSMEDLIRKSVVVLERMDSLLADFGSIVEDTEMRAMIRQSIKDMSELLDSMREIVVGEEEEFRAVVVNMNRVAELMADLLERINRAEGTLGKLITEDEIYVDLREFVSEIKTHPWRLLKKK